MSGAFLHTLLTFLVRHSVSNSERLVSTEPNEATDPSGQCPPVCTFAHGAPIAGLAERWPSFISSECTVSRLVRQWIIAPVTRHAETAFLRVERRGFESHNVHGLGDPPGAYAGLLMLLIWSVVYVQYSTKVCYNLMEDTCHSGGSWYADWRLS